VVPVAPDFILALVSNRRSFTSGGNDGPVVVHLLIKARCPRSMRLALKPRKAFLTDSGPGTTHSAVLDCRKRAATTIRA
jgi:hypothetical protein